MLQSQGKNVKSAKKTGRPVAWPEPKTSLAKSLQHVLPRESLSNIGKKYFNGAAATTVSRYLSGEREPPLSLLLDIARSTGRSLADFVACADLPTQSGVGAQLRSCRNMLSAFASGKAHIVDKSCQKWAKNAVKYIDLVRNQLDNELARWQQDEFKPEVYYPGSPAENLSVSPSRDPEIQRELSEVFPRFLELAARAQCIAMDKCDHEAQGWLRLMQSFVASLQDYVYIDGQQPDSKTTSPASPAVRAG